MRRIVAGGAALGLAVGVLGVAAIAVLDDEGGGGPPPLPVLGAGVAQDEAALSSDRMGAGGVEYVVRGELPELDGEAHAWSLSRDGVGGDRVAELADVLDVDGEVEETDGGWMVRDGDRRLDVQRQPGLPWSLYQDAGLDEPVSSDGGSVSSGSGSSGFSGDEEQARQEDQKAETRPAPPPEETTVDCRMPDCPPDHACVEVCPPEPEPVPERPADLPSQDEAERIGRALLAATGMDLDAATVRVEDGFSAWYVTADPTVGDLPTFGMGSSVAVGPKGAVEWANGWLADPDQGDAYPLIGTTAALDRLREGAAWGPTIMGAPEPAMDMPAIDCVDCPEPEPVTVTITGVRVGLQLVPAWDVEEAWLVPSYLFTVDDGGDIPVLAIADEHIAEPDVPEPQPLPEPDGREPGQVEPGSPGGDEPRPLPEDEQAEVGVGYYVDVSTHCGVYALWFDGRWWDADPPLGNGNPPAGWSEPEGGTLTLLSPDEAEFVGDEARTKVARFVARPADAGDPAGCA